MKKILLLHGALGSANQFNGLLTELARKEIEGITFEFSGHGEKDMPDSPFSIEIFSKELEQFILANKLNGIPVFAYSMGGYIALYLAARNKNTLSKIITLGTKFHWTPEIAFKEIKMLNPNTIKEKVPAFAKSLFERHGDKWELLLKRTAELMENLGEENIIEHISLESIDIPVSLGLGDSDNMVTLEETLEIRSSLKKNRFYILPGTKHPLESVNSQLLAQLISSEINVP